MRHTSIFFLLLALLFSVPLSAQKMKVESMIHDPLDQTANLSENMYKDNNGEYGGLVKVMLAAPNVKFEGWVLHQEQRNASEYWVVMAKGSNRLKVIVDKYLPLEVDFRDYKDCIIQSQRTYVLTITLPQLGNEPVDDGMRYLGLSVEPKNAMVLVDGKPQLLEDGSVVVNLPQGTHRYQVSATGYATEEGTVELKEGTKRVEVKLKSLMATLRIECATTGAQVYVNGKAKGTAPWSGTYPAGTYKVEARLDGYRTQIQNISLDDSEQRTLQIPALDMIMGILDVKVTPVNAEVFVDGKKVGNTPDVFRNIQIGSHRVEVKKDGYEPLTQTVTINENEQTPLSGALKEKPSSQMLFELGEDYYKGRNGKTKDYNKAAEYYRQAADGGHSKAQASLGSFYLWGIGVKQDDNQAVNWLRKASEQGEAVGIAGMAFCYEEGKGVPKDPSKAFELYCKAADLGHLSSICSVGECYAKGIGVSKDPSKAVEYYHKAVEKGYVGGMCYLGDCYYNGEGVSKDYSKAVEWYRKSAEAGWFNAWYPLGQCYEKGEGVEKDIEQAVSCYRKAAEHGHRRAKAALERLERQ